MSALKVETLLTWVFKLSLTRTTGPAELPTPGFLRY
jgi:hypothetical protein